MVWLTVFIVVPIYVLGLFSLAWWSDRRPARRSPRMRAAVTGLSIAVCIGPWSYFSSIGAAARNGLGFMLIYLGAVLAVLLFFPVMRRIAEIVKRENIVSVADFLSARYGKSRPVGVLSALLALFCSIPFLAQQLRGLALAWSSMQGGGDSGTVMFVLAAVLASFVMLFAIRRTTLTEHNRGLVRVVAAESILQLGVLVLVAGLGAAAVLRLHPGWEWTAHLGAMEQMPPVIALATNPLIGIAVLLCGPRLFYIAFVQSEEVSDLVHGRFVLAFYLVASCVVVVPIALAGLMLYGVNGGVLYVVRLSHYLGGGTLSALAFLGAFSCSAAPLTIEAAALAIIVSNELVLPVLSYIRRRGDVGTDVERLIVLVRAAAVCVLLALAWVYADNIRDGTPLGTLGLVNASGVAQFLPALLGGLYWRRGHAMGAIAGLVGGFAVWFLTIDAPQVLHSFEPAGGLFNLVNPAAIRPLLQPIWISLFFNTVLYVAGSLLARPRLIDRVQASNFVDGRVQTGTGNRDEERHGTVGGLKSLVAQFLGRSAAAKVFAELDRGAPAGLSDRDGVSARLAVAAERVLAGAVGATMARQVIGWYLSKDRLDNADIIRFLDDAAEAVQFNRELLQATLDHVEQGIYVVDRRGKMIAWNRRYIEHFHFPPGFVHIGQPVGEAIRASFVATGQGEAEIKAHVNLRLAHIRHGIAVEFERTDRDGRILKISGSPMPDDRYVTTYTDITELRRSALALQQVNEQLEHRVDERTRALTAANAQLAEAKAVAERATHSQARFLAAASHDLLQPLQAARLFIGTILEDPKSIAAESRELLRHADLSIESADRLLAALLNLSRLEVGGIRPGVQPVAVKDLLTGLAREFDRTAAEKGLKLRIVPSRAWVLSDSDLLRSVLQNLIGNAVRYTQSGSVLVGCRRDGGALRFEVRDSGPGIPEGALDTIFKEFQRLPAGAAAGQGVGLGLSIAERICKLLGHHLTVRSRLGEGSVFSVTVPRAAAPAARTVAASRGRFRPGLRILCVENELAVLRSLEGLLVKFGAQVSTATSLTEALALDGSWDILLADYQLGPDGNGLEVIQAIGGRAGMAALLTANATEALIEEAADLNIEMIKKPVSPAFLRGFLARADRMALS